jgi:hypothetical protein
LIPAQSVCLILLSLFRKARLPFLQFFLLRSTLQLLLLLSFKFVLPPLPISSFSRSLCGSLSLERAMCLLFFLFALSFQLQGFNLGSLDSIPEDTFMFRSRLRKSLLVKSFLFGVPFVLLLSPGAFFVDV